MRHYLSGRGIINVLFLAILLILLPIQLSAQVSINHPPLISSQPVLSVTADQTYEYRLEATDRDNDNITFALTTAPQGMTLENDTLAWQPTTVGSYNVVVQAADTNNGYDTQAWQISVKPGNVASIVITPNNKPTVVEIDANQQFSAKSYDKNNNEVSDVQLTWMTDENIGTIGSDGLFMAKIGGIGSVTAQAGEAEATIGLVVTDTPQETATTTDESTKTADTEETIEPSTTDTNTNQESAIVEETTEGESTEVIATEEQTDEGASEEEEPCTNPSTWLLILILVIYVIVLAVYYRYEKKHKSAAWWIFPFLLSIIGLMVYYKYVCPSTYLWWPWVLVGLGIILTLFYKGRRKTGQSGDDSQTELPF